MPSPLEGFRVLDLSQFLSGPRCTQLLAQAGAEVVKVEQPGGETMRLLTRASGMERMMSLINGDKKCMTLDLKKDAARGIFRRLVAVSDVLVENFAPGTMDRMRLGYEDLREINPRLIYTVITGFGRTGPYADRLAFDIIAQAMGGIMAANEREDRPPAIFFADLVAGAYAANGILLALLHRQRTGMGQLVDISLQDVMYFHNFPAQCQRALEEVQEEISGLIGKTVDRLFADPESPVPFWYSYKALDGYVVVVALTDHHWNSLLRAIGREDLVGDERFNNIVARVRNARQGLAVILPWMETRTVGEIVDVFYKAKVPCGPVLGERQVNEHPQLRARGMLQEGMHPRLGTVPMPGCPMRLTESPCQVSGPCPDAGAHTEEVLKRLLQLSDAEVLALRDSGAI